MTLSTRVRLVTAALGYALSCAPLLAATTELTLWHSYQGVQADELKSLVDRFNAEQNAVAVTLEYKGTSADTAAAALAAFRAKHAPDLVMVDEYAADDLEATKGVLKPVHEILPLDRAIDYSFLVPASVAFMKDARGELVGFPYAPAVPVLLYNRDAYQRAGLDPDAPPQTWIDLQKQLVALQSGPDHFACPYTTSEQTWIHVENLAASHNEPFASHSNGMDGGNATLTFNDLLHVRHFALLESWVKAELFHHFGGQREGDARFAAGECATLTTGSDALGDILAKAKFSVGAAPLPYYTEEGVHEAGHTIVNGSGIFALAGKPAATYKSEAQFFAFLAKPVTAAEWAQKTGNMPLTRAALQASEQSNAYAQVPGLVRVFQTEASAPPPAARGVRLPHFDQVRAAINTELNGLWSGAKSAKQALDDAVHSGDLALKSAFHPATK